MQQRLASLHQTESVAVSFDGWDNLERQMVIRDWILECARTHGNGTQGYFRAIDELVEGLGRTRVPEEEDGEDDMLADSDTDV